MIRLARAKDTAPANRQRPGARSRNKSSGHSMAALHDAVVNPSMPSVLMQAASTAPPTVRRRPKPGTSRHHAAANRETLRDPGPGQPMEEAACAPIEARPGLGISIVRTQSDRGAARAAWHIHVRATPSAAAGV